MCVIAPQPVYVCFSPLCVVVWFVLCTRGRWHCNLLSQLDWVLQVYEEVYITATCRVTSFFDEVCRSEFVAQPQNFHIITRAIE